MNKEYNDFFSWWGDLPLKSKVEDVLLVCIALMMNLGFHSSMRMYGGDLIAWLVGGIILGVALLGLIAHPFSEYKGIKELQKRKKKIKKEG